MNRRKTVISMLLALSLLTSQSTTAAGKSSVIIKKAGRATSVTPNTILSGAGIPTKSLGIDGDFYIDTKNANLYGPKTKGTWKIATSLRTPTSQDLVMATTGADGVRGATGSTGSAGARGENGATGAKGEMGATGLVGATGAIGAAGLNGTNGANGVAGVKGDTGTTGFAGATGLTGVQGLKGDTGSGGANGMNGAQGLKGDIGVAGTSGMAGITGATGLTGSTGSTGAAGAAGTAGAAGISNGKSSSITFTGNLAGSAGSTKASDIFGTFAAGKNYVVHILINTYDANSAVFTYGLGFSITATGDNPIINLNYSVLFGSIYSGGNRPIVSVIADVVLNGGSTLNPYSLVCTLTSGANGGASIAAAGMSTQILIGSIG